MSTPTWYVEHFRSFGYSAEGLESSWAGLSDRARADYCRVLVTAKTGVTS